jgi:hypothetical protein
MKENWSFDLKDSPLICFRPIAKNFGLAAMRMDVSSRIRAYFQPRWHRSVAGGN